MQKEQKRCPHAVRTCKRCREGYELNLKRRASQVQAPECIFHASWHITECRASREGRPASRCQELCSHSAHAADVSQAKPDACRE